MTGLNNVPYCALFTRIYLCFLYIIIFKFDMLAFTFWKKKKEKKRTFEINWRNETMDYMAHTTRLVSDTEPTSYYVNAILNYCRTY